MLRWVLVPLSLLISLPAPADPLIRLHHSPSLFKAPQVQKPPSPMEPPGWLVADASATQPASQKAAVDGPAKKKHKKKRSVSYGVGLTGRGIFVPFWFLEMFLDAGTALYSGAMGAEFVRRKGNFDLVASINFNFYSPPDGNFLGKGKDEDDIDYIVFDNLNVLSFEVDFVWHHNFTKWLSLVYGAGLGFGIVLGDVLRTSVNAQRLPRFGDYCVGANKNDLSKCNPTDPNKPADVAAWEADRNKWLESQKCKPGKPDGITEPCMFVEDDVWPVIPIVHLLVGLNFKVTNELNIRVTGGWHDAFYVGATTQWFFF